MDEFRQALILNPNLTWDRKILDDDEIRDVFYAISSEINYRARSSLHIPEQYGAAKLYVDGVEVMQGDDVPQGNHLIQIVCPKGDIHSQWNTLKHAPKWLKMCPYEFDLRAPAPTEDDFLSDYGDIPDMGTEESPREEASIEEPPVTDAIQPTSDVEKTQTDMKKEAEVVQDESNEETSENNPSNEGASIVDIGDMSNPIIKQKVTTLQKEAKTYWRTTLKAVSDNPKLGKQFLKAFIDEFDNASIVYGTEKKRVPIAEVAKAKEMFQNYNLYTAKKIFPKIYASVGTELGTTFLGLTGDVPAYSPVNTSLFVEGRLYFLSLKLALQGMVQDSFSFSNYGFSGQLRIFPSDMFSLYGEFGISIFYEVYMGVGMGVDIPLDTDKKHKIRIDLKSSPQYKDILTYSDFYVRGISGSASYLYRF